MVSRLLLRLILFVTKQPNWKLFALGFLLFIVVLPFGGIISAKIYQNWDDDPERGAVSLTGGEFGEGYDVPEYLDQGWNEAQSLWFYNTTQGSALLPYDFLVALEQTERRTKVECERGGEKGYWFLCNRNVDRFRYLPQEDTFFNPDALPVGFAKERYQEKDYVGLTCAACHTAQINFKGRALRIDGGPALADIVTFLRELTWAMDESQPKADHENPRAKRFVERVLELGNDYDDAKDVEEDLEKWTNARRLYNVINHSTSNGKRVRYGYARLDAFGRIYNRVLQHAINGEQLAALLRSVVRKKNGVEQRLLTEIEVEKVMQDIDDKDDVILRDGDLWKIIDNLGSDAPGYPDLSLTDILRVRNTIFNSPNAPVSYPFLWDITHSDYVQWNGLASNAGLGPLGRNAGEVIGVFAILDWHEVKGWRARFRKFSLPAFLTGQNNKKKIVNFKSSVDLFNLQRLERHLISLKSPRWPFCKNLATDEYYLPTGRIDEPVDRRKCAGNDKKIDKKKADNGELIYAKRCQGCHDVIQRNAWDRLVIGKFVSIDSKQTTDKTMASNSVKYGGKSGNFKDTYQKVPVGTVVVREDAPVVQILTAATTGVVATPDADKWWPRRFAEWIYTIGMSLADNPIKSSVKAGNYKPDTTAEPYNSLQAYRARSLNGIWATAPYLHNGSVPTLYDLFLPATPKGEGCSKIRPERFMVGSRDFNPQKVGFVSEGYDGFEFRTDIRGNSNMGHEYGACSMTDEDRWDLIEYLKSL